MFLSRPLARSRVKRDFASYPDDRDKLGKTLCPTELHKQLVESESLSRTCLNP